MSELGDSGAPFEAGEAEMEARLAAARPVPRAGFRGALGRHLAGEDPGYGPRPRRLRAIVAGYLAGGGGLLLLGLLEGLGHL